MVSIISFLPSFFSSAPPGDDLALLRAPKDTDFAATLPLGAATGTVEAAFGGAEGSWWFAKANGRSAGETG